MSALRDRQAYQTARMLAKTGLLEVSSLIAATGFLKHRRGRGLIFTLHHVCPKRTSDFDPNAYLAITPDFLETVIETLRAEGYVFIRLEDLAQAMASPAHAPFAIFTLDDGYRDNVDHALPVFARQSVPFTVFVCTGFMQRTHTMWWDTAEKLLRGQPVLDFDFGHGRERVPLATPREKQSAFLRFAALVMNTDERLAIERLNEAAVRHGLDPAKAVADTVLDETGVAALAQHALASIGAHSVSHRSMARLSDDALRAEITESRACLADVLGRAPITFAFPYGHTAQAGTREFRAVADAGFDFAVTTRQAVLEGDVSRCAFRLPRVNLDGLQQKRRYVSALASGIPFRATRSQTE